MLGCGLHQGLAERGLGSTVVHPRLAWIYASGRGGERAEAANACGRALCSASFPGGAIPCA